MKRLLSTWGLIAVLLQLSPSDLVFAQLAAKKTLTESRKQLGVSTTIQKDAPVPEHVAYEFYFRRVAFYKNIAQKDDDRAKAPQNDIHKLVNIRGASRSRNAIKNELALNDSEKTEMENIAANALRQAAAIDDKAKPLVAQAREALAIGNKNPKGKNKFPQIMAELTKLQEARNAIFMKAKASLSQRVGATRFNTIDSRVKSIILPTISVKALHR
jgi:hypothetical protein